jgi:hypothetical protein
MSEEIKATSSEEIRNKTRALPEIPDRRGPMVYDLTEDASLNGIDPNFENKQGVD